MNFSPGGKTARDRPRRIHGATWNDADGDGEQDAGESGLSGWTIFCDGNLNGTVDTSVVSNPSTGTISVAIPDVTTVTSSLAVSGVTGQISDVDVTLNITHTWDSDLAAYLISPLGSRVELFAGVGSDGDNFTNTVLDDEAGTAIAAGTAPFTGNYRPVGSLAAFDGQLPNGTWQLEITDAWGGDTGILTNWSLTLTTSEASTTTAADGTYALTGLSPGSYTVAELQQSGWRQTLPAAPAYHTVEVAAGQIVTGKNFGNCEAVTRQHRRRRQRHGRRPRRRDPDPPLPVRPDRGLERQRRPGQRATRTTREEIKTYLDGGRTPPWTPTATARPTP